MSNVTIQACDWADVQHIPAMYDTESALFMRRKTPETWFRAIMQGKTVGCACIFPLSKTKARLSNLYVIPEYRGHGIGMRLVIAREMWARQNGFTVIETRTKQNLHLKHGYRLIKQFKIGEKLLEKSLKETAA